MTTNRWTDELLDSMRKIGDAEADAVIDEVAASEGPEGVRRILASLVVNDDIVPADLPESARNYFANTHTLPDWADAAKIDAAEQVFIEHGPAIAGILVCASLPSCYACKKAVQVLHLSTQLSKHPGR